MDDKQAVIDGVQRLSTCYSYINDGFSLSKNLEPVTIGENTYEIAGKKSSKLTDIVKQFLDEYDSNEEYKASLHDGTSSAESVKVRLSYWRKVIKEL